MSRVKNKPPEQKARCSSCRLSLPVDDLVECERGHGVVLTCRRCIKRRGKRACPSCFGLPHRRAKPKCWGCGQPYADEPAPEPWGFGHSNIADAEHSA